MTIIQNRLDQVKECFENGDESLGNRRLIDAVLDTDDSSIFKQLLKLIEVSEEGGKTDISEVQKILETLTHFKYPVHSKKDELLLDVQELSKKYSGSGFAISPVGFQVSYGQVIGLVGENGNGKTTLLRLLCKDLEPDSGKITYAAEKDAHSLFSLRSRLVYIPQRVTRWFGSLMDNMHFTLSEYGIKGELNELRAELIIARLGLRSYKDLGWNRISSGYRTRFELARSLLRKPELMLLDEPLSNLDIISQQTILKDLKYLSESVTHPFGIVLSSQQLYEVEKISDLVIFLKQGSPKYQYKDAFMKDEIPEIIFELETEAGREKLMNVFSSLGVNRIQFNGGVYMLHFNHETNRNDVFRKISENDLPVRYIRDITYSSRRFFNQ